MRRDIFYYTNEDKRGLVVLLVLIVVLSGSIFFIKNYNPNNHESDGIDSSLAEYLAFREQLSDRDSLEKLRYASRRKNYRKVKSGYYDISKVVPSLFDPNSDDSAAMVRSGLPPYVARNIVRYRAKGGKFRKPEDLARIYGMTDELYSLLSPYIIITPEYSGEADSIVVARDSLYKPVFKYPKGTVVDLNKADTAELKKIPGIGSGYSAMIVGYRYRLGGFISVSQLKEIEGLPDSLVVWFSVSPDFVPERININRSSIERLRSHPYMGFYRARAIVEYRKKYGDIDDINRLKMFDEFGNGAFERIAPYLSVE